MSKRYLTSNTELSYKRKTPSEEHRISVRDSRFHTKHIEDLGNRDTECIYYAKCKLPNCLSCRRLK